jgi:hypothetical protein
VVGNRREETNIEVSHINKKKEVRRSGREDDTIQNMGGQEEGGSLVGGRY